MLEQRLSRLRGAIEGTWLEACLSTLYEELDGRGIRLRPHAWISSEWFSPANVPGIAIPFYLTHPRLMKLEKKMMLDVEGSTWSQCMAILRHEAGHAVQHGYQLQRRRRWQQLFGPSSKHYPRYYRPNPASRRYVQHLRLWYAQSHRRIPGLKANQQRRKSGHCPRSQKRGSGRCHVGPSICREHN